MRGAYERLGPLASSTRHAYTREQLSSQQELYEKAVWHGRLITKVAMLIYYP